MRFDFQGPAVLAWRRRCLYTQYAASPFDTHLHTSMSDLFIYSVTETVPCIYISYLQIAMFKARPNRSNTRVSRVISMKLATGAFVAGRHWQQAMDCCHAVLQHYQSTEITTPQDIKYPSGVGGRGGALLYHFLSRTEFLAEP